jgi:hypothetical protein
MRYTGFRAIKAGLLGDTYLEAMHIEKQNQSYDQVLSEQPQLAQVFLICVNFNSIIF